jgi:hypothetical protein
MTASAVLAGNNIESAVPVHVHGGHRLTRGRNGPLPYRQEERQYNQPGQERARDKRKRYLQWVRMEIAAPLC